MLILVLLVMQISAVSASSSEARQAWYDAKEARLDAQIEHVSAKADYAVDKTDENLQAVIDTGKEVLNLALDETQAWLEWKKIEAEENPNVPEDIVEAIQQDVEDNLAVLDELREDVDSVETQLELGITFLKIIGKYFELLADVARNTGSMWVYIGETYSERVSAYEETLRETAESMQDNEEIIGLLDEALDEIETANENIENAAEAYSEVDYPGTPFIKFAEGNSYLTAAKANLMAAQGYLVNAYNAILQG